MTLEQKTYRYRLFLSGVSALLLLLGSFQVNAELILTAPPRETPDAGQKLYGPLAAELSSLLKQEVVYQHPGNWLAYQHDMRNDKYDIVFDGPHFISWRIKHIKHKAIVKLPGTLQFVIVGKKDDEKNKSLTDLVGRKVCGIPPPNLGTLTVYAAYDRPAQQPVIVPIRGGFKKVFNAFKAGKCEGAVFRTTFYAKKLSEEDRAITAILHRSAALPNQGISVSSRVDTAAQKKITAALTKPEMPAIKSLLSRFGGKAKAFEPASDKDFANHHKLLEGVIFGW